MDAITGIIAALGLDYTLFYQLGLFIFVFFFLKTLVFNPYFKAFEERENRTQGNQAQAETLWAQTRELETLYQRKARGVNADIKAIFEKATLEATVDQERIQSEAREKAKNTIDRAREVIQGEFNRAREDLIKEAPVLGRSIADKLISKEVSQ